MTVRGDLRIGLTMLTWRAGLRAQAALGDPLAKVLSRGPDADPYRRYELVRAGGELTRSKLGVYATATHEIANSILRDSRFGVQSSQGLGRDEWQSSGDAATMRAGLVNPIDDSFLSLDPPRHTRLRRLVGPWFTPTVTFQTWKVRLEMPTRSPERPEICRPVYFHAGAVTRASVICAT